MDESSVDRMQTASARLIDAATALGSELSRTSIERDLKRILPIDVFKRVRQAGIQAARVPRAYGGPEASFVTLAEIMVRLGAGDPNVAQMLQPHFVILDWLQLDGTEAQQRKYFTDVLSGAIITNAFAERGAKTPFEMATKLTSDGRHYRLNGTKFYTTGSLIADQFYVMAVMEDKIPALVIIPADRDGVEIIDDWDGMGQRTTASGTTKLTGVAVAPDEFIPLPNFGRRRSHIGAAAQITHAAIDVGIALAALDDAVEYARTKARPVADSGVDKQTDDPYVIHTVGEMSVIAHSAEALLYRSAALLDKAAAATLGGLEAGDDLERTQVKASIAVAEAKAAANGACLATSEMMFAVGGASSTLRKYGLDRHWRNARTHTTHDPVSYKFKAIGSYMLSGTYPPISTKI